MSIRTYYAKDGGAWPARRGTQQELLVRTVLQLEQVTGNPADEMIDWWAGEADVDPLRLHAAIDGDPLSAADVARLRRAVAHLAGEPGAADKLAYENTTTRREDTSMTISKPTDWDYRKMLALAALLAFLVLALIWWAYARARKVPVCHKQPWWPKKALGKKALDAGRAVFDYYTGEGKGDMGPGFEDLPAFDYWSKVTGRNKTEWVYSQAVLAYLREGDVEIPANLPPCVFDPAADCPACVEIKILWEEAVGHQAAMGF